MEALTTPMPKDCRNDPAIVWLVGSQLLEQQEEWQLERRRFFSEATMGQDPGDRRAAGAHRW
jgi:hypothetical protein